MKKLVLLLLFTVFLFPNSISAQLTDRLCTENNLQTCLTDDYTKQIFDAALENQIIESDNGSEVFYNDACPLDRIKEGNVTEEQKNRIYDSCWELVLPTFTAQLQNSCGVNYNCTVSAPTLESVYKQRFVSGLVAYMGAIGISPTQIPRTPTPIPTYFPTPTPGGVDFEKFNQQLDNTICGTGSGESCCLQTEAFDTQGIPDPTSETGKSGGFFGTIWSKIQSFLPGFMKSGQHIAVKTLNRIQEGQGLCPGDPMLAKIDQAELKPYLWVADASGNKTNTLFSDTEEIKKIDKLLVQVESNQTSQAEKDRIWEEELNPALEGKACTCEVPSETDWSKPEVVNTAVGYAGNSSPNVLGASKPVVLGVLDANNSGITDVINYCNSLDPTEREARFQNSNLLTCQATMGNTVLTAKQVCAPIKTVPNYDVKEYESCFDCVVKDDGVWTVLGCFYSDFSRTLNERIFGLAVSIAGIVALGCIIYAAFLMQTSAGNPEKTGKAQELMTACITGLIVIIFSIFILRVIGVDILRLPGFEGPTPTPTPASDGVCTYIGDIDCITLTPSP